MAPATATIADFVARPFVDEVGQPDARLVGVELLFVRDAHVKKAVAAVVSPQRVDVLIDEFGLVIAEDVRLCRRR